MEINSKEQLLRSVTAVGNGAHIFAPKEWINEKVLIIRLEKKNVKEEILEKLYPNLEKIIGVFLYGSYARKEATENSDIDVLVIAKEKFKLEDDKKFQFVIISEKSLEESIKINPIMMYSIFKEAKAIINEEYLDKLKNKEIDKKLFKSFIISTRDSIKSDEEILELDKKTGETISNSIIYSIILRLRGIFIIKTLLNKKVYSNSLFRKWFLEKIKINYEKIYNIYQIIRQGKEIKDEIPIAQGEILLELLKEEIKTLEKLI